MKFLARPFTKIAAIVFVLLILASMNGCTDGRFAKVKALGTAGHIKCMSGNVVLYEGDSTGVISTEHQSDGWYFQEKGSNDLIRVSGACLIRN
jgi:hypothetical protein